jgi:hypothetical protein
MVKQYFWRAINGSDFGTNRETERHSAASYTGGLAAKARIYEFTN